MISRICFLGLCLFSQMVLAQEVFNIPSRETVSQSVDNYFSGVAEMQINEIRQTKKFRWFSYLPSPGYSPFAGGFNLSLNLAGPLQEIRLSHAQKTKIEGILVVNLVQASDLKNSLAVDLARLENLVSDFRSRSSIDSLNALTYALAVKKYNKNELPPSEFITASKTYEEYKLSRRKEENAIREAINNLLYKAKMDVPASNAHLNHLTKK